jgi:hypothetical protein
VEPSAEVPTEQDGDDRERNTHGPTTRGERQWPDEPGRAQDERTVPAQRRRHFCDNPALSPSD